ncbi:MAG: acyloxyacyl hydrolase [Bacteroidia bacterium]
MRKALVLLGLFGLSLGLQAQHSSLGIGVNPGFLVAHRTDLKNIESHITGIELLYEKRQLQSDWTPFYKNPVTSVGLSYFNFGQEETGSAITFQSTLQFSLKEWKRSSFNIRVGPGVGYVSKIFDAKENRRNQAIGSHWNAFMQTAFLMEHSIGENASKGYLSYGFGISHFSNGAFKMPNLGYNLPSLFFRYSVPLSGLESSKVQSSVVEPKEFDPFTYYSVSLTYARKERNFASPVTFNHKGLQSRIIRQANPVRAWRVGIDLMLDKTYKYTEFSQASLDSISLGEQVEIGLAGGHEWRVGKLRLGLEIGAYVLKPTTFKRDMYQKMGFTYNLTEHFNLMGNLKFHRGVADYFEWGLTYNFK